MLEDPESETSGDEKELVPVKSVSTSRSGRPLQSSWKSRFVVYKLSWLVGYDFKSLR